MAFVSIVSTANTIKVDLGVYASVPAIGYLKHALPKNKIVSIKLVADSSFIEVVVEQEGKWTVSYNAADNALIIDTVDGNAPSSNADLYDKLVTLLG